MSLMCKIGNRCSETRSGMCIHEKVMLAMIIAGIVAGGHVLGWY